MSEIPFDGRGTVRSVVEGDMVRGLRVLETPGHTAGHMSLLQDEASVLFVGDLIGSRDGEPAFGPPAFTADPDLSRRSLQRMLALVPDRILFSHGEELPDSATTIQQALDRS